MRSARTASDPHDMHSHEVAVALLAYSLAS
jgi:hypothetical protein